MFKLDSEQALLSAFRPKDRQQVEPPPGAHFPALVRDYLAWRQPAGAYLYLVFAVPGGAPTGIVFEANHGAGPSVPQMCDWCHSFGGGGQVTLLTARRNRNKWVGVHVCADLSCQAKLE